MEKKEKAMTVRRLDQLNVFFPLNPEGDRKLSRKVCLRERVVASMTLLSVSSKTRNEASALRVEKRESENF